MPVVVVIPAQQLGDGVAWAGAATIRLLAETIPAAINPEKKLRLISPLEDQGSFRQYGDIPHGGATISQKPF
ncbi:hypothetical protein [Streptomyces sp. NPDC002132]|uniref:hypothetical protein n=1 Tax=unclassified Streptomyces TaxID=2593676 RepID=UPI00332320B8